MVAATSVDVFADAARKLPETAKIRMEESISDLTRWVGLGARRVAHSARNQVKVCMEDFLPCSLTKIRAKVESSNVWVLFQNRGVTREGNLMQSFALFSTCLKNVGGVPLRNDQRVEGPHRKLVSNGESELVLGDQHERSRIAERTRIIWRHGLSLILANPTQRLTAPLRWLGQLRRAPEDCFSSMCYPRALKPPHIRS